MPTMSTQTANQSFKSMTLHQNRIGLDLLIAGLKGIHMQTEACKCTFGFYCSGAHVQTKPVQRKPRTKHVRIKFAHPLPKNDSPLCFEWVALTLELYALVLIQNI